MNKKFEKIVYQQTTYTFLVFKENLYTIITNHLN